MGNLDLREITNNTTRHPWEIARANFLINVLNKSPLTGNELNVLDIGCGDAYILGKLGERFTINSYSGLDTSLSESQIRMMSKPAQKIQFFNSHDLLKDCHPNLILLLDVIEHISDDQAFIKEIVDNYMGNNTYMLLTVPAFNLLFNSHDEFLGHCRRYTLKNLKEVIFINRLMCLFSGYAFLTLLPIRLVSSVYERIAKRSLTSKKGSGHWTYGRFLTNIVVTLLIIDNNIAFKLNKIGIILPGLTAWALCKKK